MSRIPASMRRAVVRRAQGRCEYCQLSQLGQEATFHVDHVVPLADDGPTTLENLALACVSCSLRKGARRRGKDPTDDVEVTLFDPRIQPWAEHFAWDGVHLIGSSPTGRATVSLLMLNRPMLLSIRREEEMLGRHPAA